MIHLILGGARSGKSRYAENLAKNLAADSAQTVTYVATATAGDDEMKARIMHHQQSRPQHWKLVEEPLQLSEVIGMSEEKGMSGAVGMSPLNDSIILIECMTLWLTNWLCKDNAEAWQMEKENFLSAIRSSTQNIIVVSNEVGSGIVPLGELTRSFVDEAGWLNQALAKIADRVTLVVAGYPVDVKTGLTTGLTKV